MLDSIIVVPNVDYPQSGKIRPVLRASAANAWGTLLIEDLVRWHIKHSIGCTWVTLKLTTVTARGIYSDADGLVYVVKDSRRSTWVRKAAENPPRIALIHGKRKHGFCELSRRTVKDYDRSFYWFGCHLSIKRITYVYRLGTIETFQGKIVSIISLTETREDDESVEVALCSAGFWRKRNWKYVSKIKRISFILFVCVQEMGEKREPFAG